MRKMFLGALVGATVVSALFVGGSKTCESCGELFNNKTTMLAEMCDVCFGWNEHKASETDNGIMFEFKNGEGYYFEGKIK